MMKYWKADITTESVPKHATGLHPGKIPAAKLLLTLILATSAGMLAKTFCEHIHSSKMMHHYFDVRHL